MAKKAKKSLAIVLAMMTLAGCAHSSVRAADAELFDRNGFRETRFRAPVNLDPAPARRISLEAAFRLDSQVDALFIDVLPVETGVRNPDTGVWTLTVDHATIPGAQWHPETGRTPPAPVLWKGLHAAIKRARKDKPDKPIILFCRTDCWMGWNAARRLAKEGIKEVYWLAEGIEGWVQKGGSLTPAQPVIVAPADPH